MISHHIESDLLSQLSQHLARHTGLLFPAERQADLIRGIEAVARDHSFKDVNDCMRWLLLAPLSHEQIKSLASRLTVGETYFFRDPGVFEILQSQILPALIDAHRQGEQRIRIWSAGCSSGEEAYSIAILLQRMIPDIDKWDISVLGTDINARALEKATAGLYGDWSFRNPPNWLQDGYFRKLGNGQYEVIPRIRQLVTFSYLNLADEYFPAAYGETDIVLCRNVLMYLTPQIAAGITQRLCRAMTESGWLIVTPAEASLVPNGTLTAVNFSGLTLHRKISVKPQEKLRAGEPPMAYLPKIKMVPRQPQLLVPALAHEEDYRAVVMDMANRGELALALQHCEKAIGADRLDPAWHYLSATILQEDGQVDKAMSALNKALYLDPMFVMAHFSLGNLYRQQDRREQAGRHLQSALRLLRGYARDDVLPESGGMTAGRLMDMIQRFMGVLENIA